VLGFNALIQKNDATAPKKINLKEEQDRILQVLKNTPEKMDNRDLQILYELLTQIGTKYTITEKEQALLTLSGAKIVQMKKEELLSAMGF